MDTQDSFRWNGGMVIGLFLLLFGSLLLLNNVDIIDVGPIWRFWPLILVVLGLNTLLNRHDDRYSAAGVWRVKDRRPHTGGGIWLIFIGLWLLVSTNHLFGLHFRDTWPLFIIAWGVSMVWRALHRQSRQRIAEEYHGT